MKNPHYWKKRPSNVVPYSILQPQKSTIVAISHYIKLPKYNVLRTKHTFCTSFSAVL